jgi:hypothetical protein
MQARSTRQKSLDPVQRLDSGKSCTIGVSFIDHAGVALELTFPKQFKNSDPGGRKRLPKPENRSSFRQIRAEKTKVRAPVGVSRNSNPIRQVTS